MPRLYDAHGNYYSITHLNQRFYPTLLVASDSKHWEDRPLLSAHTGQPLSFAHSPHATRYIVLHSRRSHRLGQRGIRTDPTVAPSSFYALYHAEKAGHSPDCSATPILTSV